MDDLVDHHKDSENSTQDGAQINRKLKEVFIIVGVGHRNLVNLVVEYDRRLEGIFVCFFWDFQLKHFRVEKTAQSWLESRGHSLDEEASLQVCWSLAFIPVYFFRFPAEPV